MNTTETELNRPERRLSMDPREDRVLALSLAYLRAGLEAEDAIESAHADLQAVYAEAAS